MNIATVNDLSISYKPFNERLLHLTTGGGFSMEDYWVWCGSVVQGEDGRYHMFAARWPKNLKFLPAYQSYSEVVRAVSDTPEGPYSVAEVVLPDRGAAFWDGRMTHNPTIHKIKGQYVLFYIGTTFTGERPTQTELLNGPDFYPCYRSIKIGVATAPSVLGPWTRRDKPFLTARPDAWDAWVVTNPAPLFLPDGHLFLYYRSYVKAEGRNKIGLAVFEGLDGKCLWRCEKPVFDSPDITIEDPFVFMIDGHFEMIAKDLNGSACGEFHAGVHLLSPDGITWAVADPPKAYSRTVTQDNRTVETLSSIERPQLLFHDGKPTHLFAAMADGDAEHKWQNMTRTWTGVIPLQ